MSRRSLGLVVLSLVSCGNAAPAPPGAPAPSGGAGNGPAGGQSGVAAGSPSGGAAGGASGGTNAAGSGARVLCVFDYDLTLSSHACPETSAEPDLYRCRQNSCVTYYWYDQCLATSAREAVAECVRREALIGIASHSDFEGCWDDKVVPILNANVFPEFFSSPHYANPLAEFAYPAVDDMANWNCDTCAYQFVGGVSKSSLIRKVMSHYGLDADAASARARVIFWDDDPVNIANVESELPGVRVIQVPTIGDPGNREGCGIGPAEIERGWAGLE